MIGGGIASYVPTDAAFLRFLYSPRSYEKWLIAGDRDKGAADFLAADDATLEEDVSAGDSVTLKTADGDKLGEKLSEKLVARSSSARVGKICGAGEVAATDVCVAGRPSEKTTALAETLVKNLLSQHPTPPKKDFVSIRSFCVCCNKVKVC